MDQEYSFRYYGELAPVKRTAEEAKKLLLGADEDKALSETALARINEMESGGYVLDFGCSFGILTRRIARKGNKVLAIDLDPESIRIARDFFPHENIDYRCQDLFESQIHKDTFDGIFFSHTIEHLFNVERFLQEFLRILKPGGYLLCATPNALALEHSLYGLFGFRDYDGKKTISAVKKEPHLADLDHVSAYTRDTLSRLVDRQGFEVESCKIVGNAGFQLPLIPVKFPTLLRKLPVFYGFGSELLLKARKPSISH